MSDQWNEVDLAILREQFPLIFMFEDDEELNAMEEEEDE